MELIQLSVPRLSVPRCHEFNNASVAASELTAVFCENNQFCEILPIREDRVSRRGRRIKKKLPVVEI